jgi:SAM-dependent methyltransferase
MNGNMIVETWRLTMTDKERAGWETLFQQGVFPPRYQTTAAPNDSVVEWANGLAPGSLILDVGSGVGRHVIYLGGRGFRMAGLDASPTGIRTTQDICAERGIDFDGHVGDMKSLPWPDATFDAAFSTSTISHGLVADIAQALAEIRRVLKPGGRLLVDFPHRETQGYQRALRQTAEGTLTEVEPNTFVDLGPNLDPTSDAFLPHHYADEAGVRDLLRGFEITRLEAHFLDKAADEEPASRGYWVAWARKSAIETP